MAFKKKESEKQFFRCIPAELNGHILMFEEELWVSYGCEVLRLLVSETWRLFLLRTQKIQIHRT